MRRFFWSATAPPAARPGAAPGEDRRNSSARRTSPGARPDVVGEPALGHAPRAAGSAAAGVFQRAAPITSRQCCARSAWRAGSARSTHREHAYNAQAAFQGSACCCGRTTWRRTAAALIDDMPENCALRKGPACPRCGSAATNGACRSRWRVNSVTELPAVVYRHSHDGECLRARGRMQRRISPCRASKGHGGSRSLKAWPRCSSSRSGERSRPQRSPKSSSLRRPRSIGHFASKAQMYEG